MYDVKLLSYLLQNCLKHDDNYKKFRVPACLYKKTQFLTMNDTLPSHILAYLQQIILGNVTLWYNNIPMCLFTLISFISVFCLFLIFFIDIKNCSLKLFFLSLSLSVMI